MSADHHRYTNRLVHETSPYLLQHAHNPVDWYPWGEEALAKARAEDKPILLSIGYSACHWCHVMAHESFEDPATAEVMNALYVNIKVDREERPDLDRIYQLAHQLLNQRGGGWPLTMILTPEDHTPIFGGTYFPREPRYGMPPFTEVLRRVEAFFRERRDELKGQHAALVQALDRLNPKAGETGTLNAAPLDEARRELADSFDAEYGGFGAAPKFPHPTSLERLLRHWAATAGAATPDRKALDMARFTLHAMASGGIYDQLGGGFCRYSVDERWMIPHFEKMLYDNGPLLSVYAQAWQATGEPALRRIAEETGQWVIREMQSPEGGYYSSLDADTEGEEGRFYVWTPEEVRAHLDPDEYAVAEQVYGLDQPPNFEEKWHLYLRRSPSDAATTLGFSAERCQELLSTARHKLFKARRQRVHPGRDEKILTAWNALMIKGMAEAGRRLERHDLIESAERAAAFLREHLYRDGRLLAAYKDGRANLAGYLDDYVFLIDALLELLQARWRSEDLDFALALAEAVLAHFEDREGGGFYFTADDHERLLHRPKPVMDESLPAGNGIAALVLSRLGHLLGETRYLDAAERTLEAAWPSITRLPYAHNALLLALEEHLYPPQIVVLRGTAEAMQPWVQRCTHAYAPRRLVFAIPADAAGLPGVLAARTAQPGKVTAWVCSGTACQAPVDTLQALEPELLPAEAASR